MTVLSVLAILAAGTMAHRAGAVEGADPANGKDLLSRNCGRCHAIGLSGASPHKLAPPFRTLGQLYPIDSLQEALAEGIVSGHPDMPEFSFEPDEVGDILAYLKSIQVKKK